MYRLYIFSRTTAALRTRIAFKLKGITPHYQTDRFKITDKSRYIRQLPIEQEVPVLFLPDGTYLSESMAIIDYLNDAHPYPHNLFPGTPFQKAQIRSFCSAIDSHVYPYSTQAFTWRSMDYRLDQSNYLQDWRETCLQTCSALVNSHNKGSPFIFGEEITAADIFLYPQILRVLNYLEDEEVVPLDQRESFSELDQNLKRILINLLNTKEFKQQNDL